MTCTSLTAHKSTRGHIPVGQLAPHDAPYQEEPQYIPQMEAPLLGFFASARYMVVKIMRSCSKMVLRTTEHTMIYSGSGPCLEVIALRPVDLY
jgi:hypothetical protein